MLPLQFHPDLYQEISDAYNWYESQAEGLGEDFLNELEESFSKIQKRPNAWSPLSKPFRKYVLKRFPYGVIYEVEEDSILVVAVMHLSRKPGYWLARIQE